ncbi:glycosyltransferase family 4 protein [Cyanobacterium aponinum]|nr:glycosyltransferase family 4 protein [Cyanobacterium aponinum]
MNENILLIGYSSQNMASGVSLSFDSLIDGFKLIDYQPEVIYIVDSRKSATYGSFSLTRVKDSLKAIFEALQKIPNQEVIYMTISSSKLGFIRDMMIIWFAWFFKKRVILHLHGGGYKDFYLGQSSLFQKLIRSTLAKSTHIVVLGELLRDQFYFVPDIDGKIKFIPNGLTTNLNTNLAKVKSLPSTDQCLRLLYLSNLIPSKGYLILLDACIKLIKNHGIRLICDFCGDFSLTVVDDKSLDVKKQKEDFFFKIKQAGLEDYIIYHGRVSGEKKEKMLREANFFVLPTFYSWEGQPLSIIEALAFGTPIISTYHKGIPEQVKDEYNGYLIKTNDPQEIIDAILKGIKSPDNYSTLSKNAIKHFQDHFTREVHLKRLISLICEDDNIKI